MAARRPKHRPIPSMTYSDWEGEQSEAAYLSDALPPPPSTRTDTQLNLAVLRRHDPAIASLHHVAPYAVVYGFSPSLQAWEKAGIEGSAFLVSLQPTPSLSARFAVVVLNRRGLDNFQVELSSPDEVEVTEEYIILQRSGAPGEEPAVFGLWVFAEPPPSSTAHQRDEVARCILEAAEKVEAGRRPVELTQAELPQQLDSYHPSPDMGGHAAHDSAAAGTGTDMARNGSLTAMLEQQRHADDAWSVRSHSPSNPLAPHFAQQQQQQSYQPPPQTSAPSFVPTADTDFFLSARPQGTGTRTTPSPAVSAQGSISGIGHKENLLDLFKRAGESYRGTAA